MEIIDFHTHPYLNIDEDLCMYADSFYLDPDEALEDLKRAGISRICGSVIRQGRPAVLDSYDYIKQLNEDALKLEKHYKGFYIPGFHIHPGFVRESLETIEFMHSHGCRLIGELVPYIHGWKGCGMDYGSKELHEILQLAGEYDMIVSYHTILDQQEQMEQMVAQNPKVTFVAAHPGQTGDYMRHIERMKKYSNLYLDISGTGLFRYGMLVKGIKEVGAQRFLFGTDYPITNPGMYVEAVNFEHISDKDKELIFAQNARRILGIID